MWPLACQCASQKRGSSTLTQLYLLVVSQMKLYQVVGRKAPTPTDENPPAYRMKLFARNEVTAKSRFWYFMHQMRKMKKTTGEILDVNEVRAVSRGQFNFQIDFNIPHAFSFCCRSWRRTPDTSRTSASGLSTTLAPALTICTASTETLLLTTPSIPSVSQSYNLTA